MKYSEETILTHPVSQKFTAEIEYINDIFESEGYKKKLFEKERALNLDKVEIKRNKVNRDSTMDMAIGISEGGKNRNILLAELKFNVKNILNIIDKEGINYIKKKIKHSIEILGNEIPVHAKKVILLNDDKKKQVAQYTNRLRENFPKSNIFIGTAKQFKEEFF
ncbi:hypothetical protein Barb7_02091 [Bacteroidales bacterium Barb7]|nr:hypothetical protein Barb7_02091 [Bacteroidales bacterium Barb7]